ncbi:methyl-accepting chemotaxis protein [Pseudoalteromonas denitrificans]|uniref:Methyl-accepting chemotaxis protein n=1 Tax=Pseudoalteromonas denitrificans DSM 6059 TaxID=1123010 RepID=A0A1I1FQ07_9GAMM|nr:methyl-accepting chemotaxis protein [Pseudoalteromonas denitrificans]SFB99698.1 Methyl-accepting chemotaxis protein [Pseudoalteromonas denitrificans DSM 6059]
MLKKFLLPIFTLLIIIAVLVAVFFPNIQEQNMIELSKKDAINTVNQIKTLRGYYTKNVIVKAKKFGMKPDYEHKDNPNSIPLPATLVHELSDIFAKDGTSFQLYSKYPFPNRVSRKLDDFQKEAWAILSKNPKKIISEETLLEGEPVLRVALADTMQAQGCVDCHNSHSKSPKTDWKLGDVRGVLIVNKPLSTIYAEATRVRVQIIIITGLIMLSIAGIMSWSFNKIVLSRTNKLNSSLSLLAQGKGDLTTELDVGEHDQIGDVAEKFNQFLTTFRGLVISIIENAAKVEDAINQVKIATGAIANKLNEQGSQTKEITENIHDVTSNIQDISQNTELASENTKETDSEIKESTANMKVSVHDIQKLSGNMNETANVISKLSKQSGEIGSVLDVIKNIAEQTNLLALNAAIEAARAGEQGRGFAVVADEVRALAKRTQDSISAIETTIASLQTLGKQAVDNVANSNKTTEHAQEYIYKVANRLEHTEELESTVANSIEQIATAMDMQSKMSMSMEKSIDHLNDSSTESLTELQNILDNLDAVSKQAHVLTEELAKFKV